MLLAENARIPIDNPATHLELTMIHEAMMLEYSARHLALMEWATALKLFNYACIGFALFIPWGVSTARGRSRGAPRSIPHLAAKLAVRRRALALIETALAKLRVFRAPEFLAVGLPVCRAGSARAPVVGSLDVAGVPATCSCLNLCAALLLLISFAMLAQRRIVNLVNLLAVQGTVLLVATLLLAWRTGQHHLYLSAALTLASR